MTPILTVIVPVHDGANDLEACVRALHDSDLEADLWELVIVLDASPGPVARVAATSGARVITVDGIPCGPAFARNRGVDAATSPLVAFVDSDVAVHRDVLSRIMHAFSDPGITAVFGSYDDTPSQSGFVSQFRNLQHHYVHQRNGGDVESFWAGCGAVRRAELIAAGMFDEATYRRPEMEDVELGYRMRDHGYRILLDPLILCTHRKRWTLPSMIRSDFLRRGIPWTRLLIDRSMLLSPKGLSLGRSEQAAVILTGLLLLLAVTGIVFRSRYLAIASALAMSGVIVASLSFLRWVSAKRGAAFAVRAVPMIILYNAIALGSAVAGIVSYPFSRRPSQASYKRRR